MEQPYLSLNDDAKREIAIRRINELEQARYVHELEQAACTKVGDQVGAQQAQQQAEIIAGKVVALAEIFNSMVPNQDSGEEKSEAESEEPKEPEVPKVTSNTRSRNARRR